jgi:spoIIIJ-associated protein
MSAVQEAENILSKMVETLGFEATIVADESESIPCLRIETEESDLLIGENGARLEDLQYLVNRILLKKVEDPPKIKIDCGGYRAQQEVNLAELAVSLAEKAKAEDRAMTMKPLNSYDRRLVHNALVDDPDIVTESPRNQDRMKRITIRPR